MQNLLCKSRWGYRVIAKSVVALCGMATFCPIGYTDILGVAETIVPEYFLKADVTIPDPQGTPYQVLIVKVPANDWPWAESVQLCLLDSNGSQLYEEEMYFDGSAWNSILSTTDRTSSVYDGHELPLVDMPFLTDPSEKGTLIFQTTPSLTAESLRPSTVFIKAAKQAGELLYWNSDTEVSGIVMIPEPSRMTLVTSWLIVFMALFYRRTSRRKY